MSNRPLIGRLLVAIVALAGVLGPARSEATQVTTVWDGGAGNGLWLSANNWNPNGLPTFDNNANLQFAGTTQLSATNNSAAAITIRTLTFNTGAGAFTLSGTSVTLSNAAGAVNNSTNTQTISFSSLGLTSASTQFDATSGELVINSSITGNGFDVTGTRVTLNGSNSNTGANTVTSGALRITNASALGTTAAGTTVSSGAALELSGGISIGAETLSLNGTGISSGGALRNISGDNTYGGVITLAGATRINSDAGTLTIDSAGSITGNFGLTFGGAGNIVLSDPFSPATTTQTLTKDGTGNLTLSAASTFTGLTTVSGGTLTFGIASALASGGITISGGSTLDIASFSDTVGTVTLTSGNIVGTTGVLTSTNTFALTSGTVSAILGATGFGVAQAASGTTVLSGANTFTGASTVAATGVLNIRSNTALGTTAAGTTVSSGGALELQGGITIGAEALSLSGSGISNAGALRNISGANTYGGALTLASATRINSDSGTLTLTGNTSGAFGLTFGGAGNTVVSGTIATSTGTLTKDGIGTLTLSASNSFTGATAINAGTLALGNANALRNSTAVTVGSASTAGTLAVGSVTGTLLGSLTTAGTATLSFTGSAGTIGSLSTGSLTFGAVDTIAVDFSAAAPTLGSYNLLTYTARSGTADTLSLTGATGYRLVYAGAGSGTVALQQQAVQSFTATAVSSLPRVLTGTTTTVTGTLANSALTNGSSLAVSLSGSSFTGFSSAGGSSVAAGGGTSLVTGTLTASATAGNQVWSMINTDAVAASTTATATGTLAVVDQRTFSVTSSTVALGRFLTNTTPTGTTGVASSGLNAVTATGSLGSFGSLSGLSLSLTSGSANFAGAAASQTAGYTISGSVATAGAVSGTVSSSVTAELGSISPVVVTLSGTAVNQRTFTSGTLALGPVHVGKTISTTTGSANVTSTGNLASTASGTLGSVSGGPAGLSLSLVSGSSQFVGAAGAQTAVYAASGSATTLGSISGTYSIAVAAELGSIPAVSIPVTGQVYSGTSTWATNGGGSWGTLTGTGTSAFGTNWGTNQGSPGLDSGFTTTDTATFGSAFTGSGTAAIYLDGATPSLKALTFSNAAGSYAIFPSNGSGPITMAATGTATVTVTAGHHDIHTDITLGSTTIFDIAQNSILTLHTTVGGSGGLTKAGSGILVLETDNTYTGNTLITSGTVQLVSGLTPLSTGTVTLTGGSVLDLNFLPVTNVITITSGTVLNTGTGAVIQVNGATTFGQGAQATGQISVNNGGSATFTIPLGGSGTNAGITSVYSGGTASLNAGTGLAGTLAVYAGGTANVAGTVNGTVTVSGSGATTGNATLSGQLNGDLTVNAGGVVSFSGQNAANSTFDVASGGRVVVSGTIGGELHVSGTATISGAVLAGADTIVQAGGRVELTDTATFQQAILTNNGTFVVNRAAGSPLSLATAFSGTGGITKLGTGKVTLTGTSTMSGGVTVSSGTLVVNGQFTQSNASVASGASIGGSGTVNGTLSGNGLVEPGNSPGILTFADLTASGSMSFAFEFTQTGDPTWNDATASGNDVLRLTDTVSPFNTALTATNVIDIYIGTTFLNIGDTFRGGFFTDGSTSFYEFVKNADFNIWVRPQSGSGTRTYNGVEYVAGDQYFAPVTTFHVGTANFSSGTVDGTTLQFVAVPEPSTWVMGLMGLVGLVAPRLFRRRSTRG